jgi:hypothetical protein
MKVIICFVLPIFLFIAGCGNFQWFPEDKTAKQPNLTKAFSTTSTIIGSPVTLTFTITNASGNPAQSDLGFTDNLPAITKTNGTFGMFVANPPNVTSTGCGSISTAAISAGDTALTFSDGSIGVGPATCTITVQVTSNGTTNSNLFVNGFSNITNVIGNLNNIVSSQSLAFTPITQGITNGTLSARDLVVSLTGSPQFSLFIDNSSTTDSANVTVTVIGKDSTGTTVSTVTIPATGSVNIPAGSLGTHLTLLSGVTSTAITWQISSINVQ